MATLRWGVPHAGLEVSLDTFSLIKPLVRFMYNAIIARIASVVTGSDDGC